MHTTTVNWVNEGKSRRPDIPGGVNFERLEDHGDSVTIRVLSDNWPPRTYKADIWHRMTDSEAEAVDQALSAPPGQSGVHPVKLRRLWEDSMYINHEGELFGVLMDIAKDILGEERALEVLAPSEV